MTTKEREIIGGMFQRILGVLESLMADQSLFRADLTRDVMRLVERSGNAAA